jgi:DNA polymerase
MLEKEGRPNFIAWRNKARELLVKGVPPELTFWQESFDLFAPSKPELHPLIVPKAPAEFMELAQFVACARYEQKWALLYRLIYRLNHENPNLLKVSVDKDVRKAQDLAKSVRRDIHKMHAFVRFKKTQINGEETYVAWHQPEHLIIETGTPFFARRFGDKPWSIFTPDASAHWNLEQLSFSKGMTQNDFEHQDEFDEVWKTYYRSIFNPSRLKIKAMKAEMSPKYWASLPEADIIHELIRETPQRLQNMAAEPRYLAEPPKTSSWEELKTAAHSCTACPLASKAKQTVFGEGNLKASLMIVGEQPGDEEDILGQAFVGPAGKILAEALKKAGIQRENIYVTNTVKHFKYTYADDGKARIHKKASGGEQQACKPWLEAEINMVRPKVILALGVTAGTALFGKLMKIGEERGKIYEDSHFAQNLLISWHPSAILRAYSEADREQKIQELISDLSMAFSASFQESQPKLV